MEGLVFLGLFDMCQLLGHLAHVGLALCCTMSGTLYSMACGCQDMGPDWTHASALLQGQSSELVKLATRLDTCFCSGAGSGIHFWSNLPELLILSQRLRSWAILRMLACPWLPGSLPPVQ